MNNIVSDIIDFNQIILGIRQRSPQLLYSEEYNISIKCLLEEIQEFQEAHAEENLVGCIDALLDLVYFNVGVLYKLGLDENDIHQCFGAVHLANMTKKKGVNAKRDTGAADAVKNDSWVGPEQRISGIIHEKLNNR